MPDRAAVLLLVLSLCPAAALAREKETPTAQVSINTGRAGCTVELDAAPAGKTDAQGRLVLADVEATDHYLHVRCPDDAQETAYLVSPRLGENAQIRHGTSAPSASASAESTSDKALDRAEVKIKLRELVKEDRKSTRLNSSHGYISYAVFCLKKKKQKQESGTGEKQNTLRAIHVLYY